MDTYYTPHEVADRLKLSVQVIYEHIRTGRLTAVKLGGRYRVAEQDLQAFLRAAKTSPERPSLSDG